MTGTLPIGMIGGLGVFELSLITVILLLFLIPLLFYILTLKKALSRCSEQNRAMPPKLVWLLIIPGLNFFWQFYVVIKITNSFTNEFKSRNIDIPSNPTQVPGLAMAVFTLFPFIPESMIPFIGNLSLLLVLVLWIVYWVQVSQYSSKLANQTD